MVQEQITLFLGCLAEFEFGSFQRSPLTQKGILILGFNDRQDEDWSRCGAGRSGPEFLAEIEAEDLPLTGAADVEAMGIVVAEVVGPLTGISFPSECDPSTTLSIQIIISF